MNNERFPSNYKSFFLHQASGKLPSLVDCSEKNNMILIFSAKLNNFKGECILSNYLDHDQKLEFSYM
jgi:mRNA-degrading endonuclease YafQ of YafQ-DinJ toxin-antitoxin module